MLAALTEYLPATRNFLRQIVPPVLATLIAALLIAGFNRAFTGHLVQPRMAALHSESADVEEAPRPASTAATMKPRESAAAIAPVTGILKAPERIFAKESDLQAEKDQTAIKISAPAAVPAAPRVAVRKSEPQMVEPRIVTGPGLAVPVVPAPAPVVTAAPIMAPAGPTMQPAPMQPPQMQPVQMQPMPPALAPAAEAPVMAAKPMVTVPDRARPAYPAQAYPTQAYPAQAYPAQVPQTYPAQTYPTQAYPPPAPPTYQAAGEPDAAAPRPAGRFVDALRPSNIFDRMREFGERIEAAGNEILPTIRQ